MPQAVGVPSGPYAGRRICLTTLHRKERALARPFALGLGASLQVSACDTNALGSFSGEVERSGDALSTCRHKAMLGLAATGLQLGLASEASFGPHPAVPMLPVGQELLVFLDLAREITITAQRLEWRTNYGHTLLAPGEEPTLWLGRVGFPSHGVLARAATVDARPPQPDADALDPPPGDFPGAPPGHALPSLRSSRLGPLPHRTRLALPMVRRSHAAHRN